MINFGDPALPDRFWDKLIPEPNTGCWIWLAGTSKGRPMYWAKTRFVMPARMVYEIAFDTRMPSNHRVSSACGTDGCCNPLHVEFVSPATAEQRRQYKTDWQRRKYLEPEFVERRRANSRAAYARDPEKAIEFARRWQRENQERARSTALEYRKRNPDKIKAQSRKQLLRRYGLSVEQFDLMFAAQSGRCAICDGLFEKGRGTMGPHIDHCHATGRVRGLLCGKCNFAIGLLADEPERCHRAAAYLATADQNGENQ